MRNLIWIWITGLYAIGVVVTFGHAAASNDRWFVTNCQTAGQRINGRGCYGPSSGFVATFSALGWPLYWSWEAWS